MKADQIHPELRKTFGRIPPLPFHSALFRSVVNTLLKIAPKPKVIAGVPISEEKLDHVSVRVYRPPGELSGAALLWIHGGGLITGAAAMNDRECARYARELRLVVVSVDYRLAPQHPAPAAIDDCFAAWQWLQNRAASLGVDPARIAISGQSAGGGLAACLCQRIQDAGGVQPAAQALFCPMLDDRTAARRDLDVIKHRVWNNHSNCAGWSAYLGQAPGLPAVPPYTVAARRAELSGLPRTWIGIGDIDLFHDEARAYAQRLTAAGVSCEFDAVPMAPHAFETFVPNAPVVRRFMDGYYRFLQTALQLQ